MCKDKCEYNNTSQRKPTTKRNILDIRYAQLWSDVVLPKLLKGKNFNWNPDKPKEREVRTQ
jgi:hypothetical protein